jgi:hypothetical protein
MKERRANSVAPYMHVVDQPHMRWVNLYNRKEKRSRIQLPVNIYTAAHIDIDAELAAGIVRGILWPRICTTSFTIYHPPFRERFKNGVDKLGGWKHNPDERTQRI